VTRPPSKLSSATDRMVVLVFIHLCV